MAEICEKYLDWTQKHRAPRTYDWYKDHIQSFINSLADPVGMAVSVLKPFHVVEWADKHANDWGDNYRRGAVVAIQRLFNWAAKLGYIEVSPIRYIEKPQASRAGGVAVRGAGNPRPLPRRRSVTLMGPCAPACIRTPGNGMTTCGSN